MLRIPLEIRVRRLAAAVLETSIHPQHSTSHIRTAVSWGGYATRVVLQRKSHNARWRCIPRDAPAQLLAYRFYNALHKPYIVLAPAPLYSLSPASSTATEVAALTWLRWRRHIDAPAPGGALPPSRPTHKLRPQPTTGHPTTSLYACASRV